MAGVVRPTNKVYIDPATGRITLEFDAFLSALVNAVNAVSQNSLLAAKIYTVATVPDPVTEGAGRIIYVSDEAGGPVLAYSDGTNWLRVSDAATIS